MGRISLMIWMVLMVYVASAQQNRYMVFFSDKEGTPYTLSDPAAFLSDRAIERRERQLIQPDTYDLPVNPAYLEQVRALSGKVYYPSKWLNATLVQCTEAIADEIRGLEVVDSVVLAAVDARFAEGGRRYDKFATETSESLAAANDFQLMLHGIPELHELGLRGEGMMVAIMDGGFGGADTIRALQHVYEEGRLLMSENLVDGTHQQFPFDHGTRVMSVMAGLLPGEYEGIIPAATYLLFGTEDPSSEQRIEEYNWIVAAEKADSAGADVINTSLGYSLFDNETMDYSYEDMDGNTALITQGANRAASRGMLVVVSAGNSGNSPWKYITAPADAQNILAVGAVTSARLPASFSSFGPTFDGRVKPEVSSLGSGTVLVRGNGEVASSSGTSFSAPVIAGFATALWQQDRTLNVTALRSYIISLGDLANNPDNQLGYGIPTIGSRVTSLAGELSERPTIFPVPVRSGESFTVRTGKYIREVRLISAEGRIIPLSVTRDGADLVLTADLLPGVYILTLASDNTTWSLKLVSN